MNFMKGAGCAGLTRVGSVVGQDHSKNLNSTTSGLEGASKGIHLI